MKKIVFALGLLLLFGAEILRVYFIMPFPGSQKSETIEIAYFLHNYIWYIRILAILLIIWGLYGRYPRWRIWQKALLVIAILFFGAIFYFFNFRFQADKMFYQPQVKSLLPPSESKVADSQLVLGVSINNQSKAYPIEIIGYHHQVKDTVGGQPVIVTYCTVCRTGRAYSPVVDGKHEDFRLVGMDHFNAMFEDQSTKSWWRQVSGEAIAGPQKGKRLNEIASKQLSLSAWLRSNPQSLILQPDTNFQKHYDGLKGFDNGTVNSGLEKRDSGSWNFKSWVIGVEHRRQSRAYDWSSLLKEKVVNDSITNLYLLVSVEPDSVNFHVWNREVDDKVLRFALDSTGKYIRDLNTNSIWNYDGTCTDGYYKGRTLQPIQAYQEFWHSWQSFHPNTTQYKRLDQEVKDLMN